MGDSGSEGLSAHGDNFRGEHLEKGNPPGSSSPGEIRKAVAQCLLSSSSTLDVSRKNIKHLTEEIYRQPSKKYFHLERNVISTVPQDLFQKLPHLVWLDLRYNKITALPPGTGHHRQLKTLLLEKNPIKELPTELGVGEPPKSVAYTEPNPCASHDPHAAAEGTAAVGQLNLGELLQCGLDLSGEWPNEEEEPSLERPSGAALQGTRLVVGTQHGEQRSASLARPPW